MVTLSANAIENVARQVEPYIEKMIRRGISPNRDDIVYLAKHYSSHQISSNRSVGIVASILGLNVELPEEDYIPVRLKNVQWKEEYNA